MPIVEPSALDPTWYWLGCPCHRVSGRDVEGPEMRIFTTTTSSNRRQRWLQASAIAETDTSGSIAHDKTGTIAGV